MIKLYLFLCLSALLFLPNMDGVSYLFSGTPLVAWKQLLSMALLFGFFIIFAQLCRDERSRSVQRLLPLILIVLIAALISSIFSLANDILPYRLLFGLISYIGFFPLVLLPFLLLKTNSSNLLFKLVILVGVVGGVGLIVDYSTDILAFLPKSEEISEASLALSVRRATFLFGAPTTIYPTISFAMLVLLCSAMNSRGFVGRYLKFVYIAILFTGLIVTGSRSQVVLAMALMALGAIGWLLYNKDRVFGAFFLMITVIPLVLVASYGLQKSEGNDYLLKRFQSAFEKESKGNEIRYKAWEDGIALFGNDVDKVIIGVGIGSSAGQVVDGHEITPHYESSFFQAVSEAGVFGLIIRYAPGLAALFFLFFTRAPNSYFSFMLKAWMVTYFASIYSAPTAGSYHVQATYFLVVGLSACWPYFDPNLQRKLRRRTRST